MDVLKVLIWCDMIGKGIFFNKVIKYCCFKKIFYVNLKVCCLKM